MDQCSGEFDEIDEIIKVLMSYLPSFSGINYEIWATEMKKILWKVYLLNYVKDYLVNSNHDMNRDASTLHLIISTLDENILFSILHEYGEIQNAKVLWDILEMKYNLNENENDESIVLENDDCAFSLIIDCETEDGKIEVAMMDDECVPVVEIETCDAEETTIDVEYEYFYEESLPDAETHEVKFDENYVSHEEWFNLMRENHLIDDLLIGEKRYLPPYTNKMQDNMFATT